MDTVALHNQQKHTFIGSVQTLVAVLRNYKIRWLIGVDSMILTREFVISIRFDDVCDCRILVSRRPADSWTAYLPRKCRWIDTSHVNVLGRSILIKWTNAHAAQVLSHKRDEMSWRQPCYFWFLQVSAVYRYSIVMMICNHHHYNRLAPSARIFLTLSRYPSLSYFASGRSSRRHPVSTQSCCI